MTVLSVSGNMYWFIINLNRSILIFALGSSFDLPFCTIQIENSDLGKCNLTSLLDLHKISYTVWIERHEFEDTSLCITRFYRSIMPGELTLAPDYVLLKYYTLDNSTLNVWNMFHNWMYPTVSIAFCNEKYRCRLIIFYHVYLCTGYACNNYIIIT